MARTLRALSFALLPYLSLAGVAACGGGHRDSVPAASGPGLDAGASPPTGTAPPLLAVSATPPWDAGLPRVEIPSESPDAGTPRALCVPKPGVDEPDDDFADTNCDGIDGDASAAIFVAPTGSDANDGSMGSPVRTLRRAIALAASPAANQGTKPVYVCSGQYPENVAFDRTGVSLYAGYDCSSGWKRRADRAVVNPPSGTPLVVTGVSAPIVFEWLAFRAADATVPSESSIAASVFDSTSVRFSHVEFTAGNGADGVAGAAPVAPEMTLPTAALGADAPKQMICSTTALGAGVQPSSDPGCDAKPAGGSFSHSYCPDGAFIWGGPGGKGGNFALGSPPEEGLPGLPQAAGFDGLPGALGKPGAGGIGFGEVASGRYVPGNSGQHGGPGRQGEAGHGGAGGTSTAGGSAPAMKYALGGGGGQGGFPGCGGVGGLPGGGGGGSIAVLIDGSVVTLDRPLVFAGLGGRGGAGSDGTDGLPGAPGAPGGAGKTPSGNGASGGHGGDGGKGGAGGPGGGGPSIGVACRGTAPVITTAVFAPGGVPGAGGLSSTRTAESGVQADTYFMDPPPGDAGK